MKLLFQWLALAIGVQSGNIEVLAQKVSSIPDLEANFNIELLKSNLNTPWSMKVTPDNKFLIFTSRDSGEISQLNLTTHEVVKLTSIPAVRFTWQAGLLGIDLDTDFTNNRWVYICYSTWNNNNPENRVSRITLPVTESLTADLQEKVLIDHIPGHANYHNGCQVILNGQNLVVSTGDAANLNLPQDIRNLAGKILRINKDGTIPLDNPWPESPVFSVGHRNPLGLAVHPETKEVWSTEHGPETRDELNKILGGNNYGWPFCIGVTNCGYSYMEPATAEFDTNGTVAISELIFYSGAKNPNWKNNIFFVTLKTARLYRIELASNGRIANTTILLDWMKYGQRFRDIAESPEGDLIISTENYPNPSSSIIRFIPSYQFADARD